MSRIEWEADKINRLDRYILDYLVKRKLHSTAKTFQAEANVSEDPVAFDEAGGPLYEWWCSSWDTFVARTSEKHSDAATSYTAGTKNEINAMRNLRASGAAGSLIGVQGITLSAIWVTSASTSEIECCDFSSDGKLLATGGHDRKVTLWCTESFTAKYMLEEHTQCITNLRFSPSTSHIATSSADTTVRIWDVDYVPEYSLRTFTRHSTTVTSVDFNPVKEDLVCSCDSNGEMRDWSIKDDRCVRIFRGPAVKISFQPSLGRLLAGAAENSVYIFNVETHFIYHTLQGHRSPIRSFSWDSSGEYLATVSDDSVRVWNIGSGSKGECIRELACTGNKFHTSAFHPSHPSVLVIGCYQTMELWDIRNNETMTLNAHGTLISALAVSKATGLIASACHDTCVKLWKSS